MKYRGFELDRFQQQAVSQIDHNRSVLVSAPTGAGKTLIADYTVEQVLSRGGRCLYTSPLKALSNQKYRDFISYFGKENVGIMTGDVVIQIEAPLLIMTTEVLRNILHRDPGRVSSVQYVIFDELHFLANLDRGTVWEECLILLPTSIKILGLSATVKNVDEIAAWLSEIKKERVRVITHQRRPVPLKILGFTKETGLVHNRKIDTFKHKQIQKYQHRNAPRKRFQSHNSFQSKYAHLFEETTYHNIIQAISPEYLPCLFFLFSRQGCENAAVHLKLDLTSSQEKSLIEETMSPVLEAYGTYESTERLCSILRRGIGYHHAGLFPFLKELVETLYEKKLVKVLFCTSTFALGVNMPAKTVLFDKLVKYDGKRVRALTALEFFQKAGRAGRRGLDTVGYVIINRNLRRDDPSVNYRESDIEPIQSALNLSYNSIINLLEKYTIDEIRKLLSESFWTFQHRNKIIQQEQLLGRILSDIDESETINVNNDPHSVNQYKMKLDNEFRRYEKKKTDLLNTIHRTRNRKQEFKLLKDMDRVERKIRELTDEKKNIEVLNIVLEGSRKKKPSKRIRKIFVKLRRTTEQIQYFKDFLFNVFQEKVHVLMKLGFIDDNFQLLAKAEICKYLYIQELFVTEMIYGDLISDLDELELNALLNCIGQSERKRDLKLRKKIQHPLKSSVLRKIKRIQYKLREVGADRFDPFEFNLQYATVAYLWSKGYAFSHILMQTELQEGDVISSFRQTIDLLKQLKDVFRNDVAMITKINVCIDCLDRDVVKVII